MPVKEFRQNYDGRIRIDETEIAAETNQFKPGLIVPIHLSLDRIQSSTQDQCVLMDVHAILLAGEPVVQLSVAERQLMPQTIGMGHEFALTLRFPLDTRRAAQIEKSRQTDAPISFRIKPIFTGMELMVAKKGNEEYGQTRLFLTAGFAGPEAEFSINIPQSHWVRNVLPHLNVTEYLLVEVPSKTNKKLSSAWDHIAKAETSYLDRNTKAVFAHCREAGDAINATLRQELGEKSFAFAERWGRTHKLFSHLASLDLHIEAKKREFDAGTVTIEKADMENVLFIAKSLVRFAEQLLASVTK